MSDADARRLVVDELGGIWTQARVDGAAMAASTMFVAWNNGDLTGREAEALLRYVSDAAPRPTWLQVQLAEWKDTYLA